MGSEGVIVYVGPDKTRYLVHKALLTTNSDYFDKALNGPFLEAEEQIIHLPEESPAAFDLLVGWLYQNKIPIVQSFAGSFLKDFKPVFNKQPSVSNWFPSEGSISSPSQMSIHIVQAETEQNESTRRNTGTGNHPFRRTIEPYQLSSAVATWHDHHQSIAAQPEYHRWSFEELRLMDYQQGRIDTDGAPPGAFGQSSGVLSLATAFGYVPDDPTHSSPSNIDDRPITPESPSLDKGKSTTSKVTFFGPPGRIPGIPVCPSIEEMTAEEEEHQFAVLELCLLAETFCWDKLFNHAMDVYIHGEANLSHRFIPLEHLHLIYQRAHDRSPCRAYAADTITHHLRDDGTRSQYIDFITKDNPAFMEDMVKSFARNAGNLSTDPTRRPHCTYHVHVAGEHCPSAEQEVTPPQRQKSPSRFGMHTDRWMEFREPNMFTVPAPDGEGD